MDRIGNFSRRHFYRLVAADEHVLNSEAGYDNEDDLPDNTVEEIVMGNYGDDVIPVIDEVPENVEVPANVEVPVIGDIPAIHEVPVIANNPEDANIDIDDYVRADGDGDSDDGDDGYRYDESDDTTSSDDQEDNEDNVLTEEQNDAVMSLQTKLAQFVLKHNLTRDGTHDMLQIWREEGFLLPKTRETLLKTTRTKIVPRVCAPGEYHHFGLSHALAKLNLSYLAECESVVLDISIDGLALAKSSKLKIWPILGAFSANLNISPFLIGAYVGYHDPGDIDDFLSDFVNELKILLVNGVNVTPRLIHKPLMIRCFVCDAPARSFLAGVHGHQALYGCNKCNQCCERIIINGGRSRRAYLRVKGVPRTDNTFRTRLHLNHHKPKFQNQYSLLESLNIGMVSQVPIDAMHLVDEGAMNRMLTSLFETTWANITCQSVRLTTEKKEELDELFVSLSVYVPSEFERKPRSIIHELCRWKAVEFRFFLNYAGCVVLKDFVTTEFYNHFMLLVTAVRWLSAPGTYLDNLDAAQVLIERFVQEYPDIYYPTEVVYNIHGLLHITEDVRKFGPLYSYSAYKFENHMRVIRKMIRKPNQIIQQMYKRVSEIEDINRIPVRVGLVGSPRPFNDDRFPNCNTSYKAFQFEAFVLNNKINDNACMLLDGTSVEVWGFGVYNDENVIFARPYVNIRNFFTYPVDSSEGLGILQVDRPTANENSVHSATSVHYKYVKLPYKNSLILIPMLHHIK